MSKKRSPEVAAAIEEKIARLKPYEIEPPEGCRTGKNKRVYERLCYQKAFEYIVHVNPDNARLVHGIYTPLKLGHAWIELPGEIVFDGVMQRFYSKDGYYRELEAEKIMEYSVIEVCQNVSKYQYHGPWHQHERYFEPHYLHQPKK